MGWLTFNLSQRIWSKRKGLVWAPLKTPDIFKLLVSNCHSSLAHFFSESKDQHENLNKGEQDEHESPCSHLLNAQQT